MAQRLGAVFAIASGTAVFSAYGHLGSPAAVTACFRPALWSCVVFAVLAAATAAGITSAPAGSPRPAPPPAPPHAATAADAAGASEASRTSTGSAPSPG